MPALKERTSDLHVSTRLCEWGSSRAIRIPKRMCEDAGISIGSSLDMQLSHDEIGDFILIRPSGDHRSHSDAPYVSIDELFANYDGTYQPTEFDWGCDLGKEAIS